MTDVEAKRKAYEQASAALATAMRPIRHLQLAYEQALIAYRLAVRDATNVIHGKTLTTSP